MREEVGLVEWLNRWIGVVGVLVAITTATWTIFFTDRDGIAITVVSSLSLLQTQRDMDNIQIFYRDRRITNLTRARIAIKNTGNRALVAEDFVVPITIQAPDSYLVGAKVDAKSPSELKGDLELDELHSVVRWKPELFNPGDELILLIDYGSSLTTLPGVVGRVKGIRRITLTDGRSKEGNTGSNLPWWIVVTMEGLLLAGLTVSLFQASRTSKSLSQFYHTLPIKPSEHD